MRSSKAGSSPNTGSLDRRGAIHTTRTVGHNQILPDVAYWHITQPLSFEFRLQCINELPANMRKIILIILVFCLSPFAAAESFAQCACSITYRNISGHNEFKLADVVFIGKVIGI